MGSGITKRKKKSSEQENPRTSSSVQSRNNSVRSGSQSSSSSSSSSEHIQTSSRQPDSGRQQPNRRVITRSVTPLSVVPNKSPSVHSKGIGRQLPNRRVITRSVTPLSVVPNKSPSVHSKGIGRQLPNRRVITRSVTPLSVAPNKSPSVSSKGSGQILPNDTNHSTVPFQQQNNNDHHTKNSSPPPDRASKARTSFSSGVHVSHPTRTNSNVSNGHHLSLKEKPSTTVSEQSGRCPHCPHCNRVVPVVRKLTVSQPSWIIEDPGTNAQHIILDNFDEEAVRNKVISEKGRVPGSYDYLPYLTMEETKSPKDLSNKYCTLPVVANAGPPISSTRTPFPNYNTTHRREHWLDKPYTLKLFTD